MEKLEINSGLKQIVLYNATHDVQNISPIYGSKIHHSGANIVVNEEFDVANKIRLQFTENNFDFLTRPFYFVGDKYNLSNYFSPYQYQSNLIEIPCNIKMNEFDMKIAIPFMQFCHVSILGGSYYNDKESKIFYPKNEFYAVIKNNSQYTKNVDLVDVSKQIFEGNQINDIKPYDKNPLIHIFNNNINLNEGNVFNKIRVLTKNGEQFNQGILFTNEQENKEESLILYNRISIGQMQSNIIEADFPFVLTDDMKITVNIMPKTTVMYHFIG